MPAAAARPIMTDPQLQHAAELVIERAVRLIRERHESGIVPTHLHYHNSEHTLGVVARAQAIGVAMEMSERHLLLTTIAAAFHDSVQHWGPVEKDDGIVMRKRSTGRDEVASGHEAVEAMVDLGVPFTPEEQGIVASAIVATIPGWDAEVPTVSQPFLIEHPVISAVAMADIGAAGMDPDMYRRDGPALFAEENLDLIGAVMAVQRGEDIDPATQERYRNRYIAWLEIQPGFAAGRRYRLENTELQGFAADTRQRVLALFSHFDESIAAAEAAAERARSLDFVPLMRQLDPRAFPGEPA
jgi:hypothetical protein